jgi:hypothetical protein
MLQKLKDSWWIFSGILIPVASFGFKFYLQVHDMNSALRDLRQDVTALSATVGTMRSVQVDFDKRLPLLQYQVNTLSAKLNVLIPPDPGPLPEIK